MNSFFLYYKLERQGKLRQRKKLFVEYVDDIIYTVEGDPNTKLNRVNSLHQNLQFNVENANEKEELASFDMKIVVNQQREITCK